MDTTGIHGHYWQLCTNNHNKFLKIRNLQYNLILKNIKSSDLELFKLLLLLNLSFFFIYNSSQIIENFDRLIGVCILTVPCEVKRTTNSILSVRDVKQRWHIVKMAEVCYLEFSLSLGIQGSSALSSSSCFIVSILLQNVYFK